ncbi:universal stress protein [Telmatospirillum sp. J64-1]|uniref:universal stress protein n=1 Tax=Telmatospirillum sp. J64-1 TaxID=2502183 RepID=UPI00115EA87A|nr:universal stress protein [Telmatospirillum sp. J64-1]
MSHDRPNPCDTAAPPPAAARGRSGRTWLVVLDDTEEMGAALRFAIRRAEHTGGRVALLHVVEHADLGPFFGVRDIMEAEAREEAERLLHRWAEHINGHTGEFPALYLREGDPLDQLLRLIDEEPSISVLVLAAGTEPGGPGPLITALTGKHSSRLRIPLTILPGCLSNEEIDALT